MSDAKTVWNRAHEARREDERARALRSLHDYIDALERDNAKMKATVAELSSALAKYEGVVSSHAKITEALEEFIFHEWCSNHGPLVHRGCEVCAKEARLVQTLIDLMGFSK